MNNSRTSLLRTAALAAALAASAVSSLAADDSDRAARQMAESGAVSLQAVKPNVDAETVELGATRITVIQSLGRPHRRVGANTWIYGRYDVDGSDAGGVLVVSFDRNRVAGLSLVSPAAAYAMREPARREPVLVADRR